MSIDTQKLIDVGYRRTSNKYGLISRIDRPDWKEYMAKQHAPWNIKEGLKWVECLEDNAENHYRRCYSKDKLEIGQYSGKKIPTSNREITGYIEKGVI